MVANPSNCIDGKHRGPFRATNDGVTLSANFTRPNDTTAYAANDVISSSTTLGAANYLTWTCAALPVAHQQSFAAGVYITGAKVYDSAYVATMPTLELWIFDGSTPNGTLNDNAACAFTDADLTSRHCTTINFTTSSPNCQYIGLPTAGAGGNSMQMADGFMKFVKPTFVSNVATLSGALVVRNAYVPVAQEVFTVNIDVLFVS